MAFCVDTRRPEPSTATTVTSVSPIMSAAAVAAVRPGLRTALGLAISPGTPAAGFADRVGAGELAGGAAGGGRREADDAGERLDQPRGEQRDAGEQAEHA